MKAKTTLYFLTYLFLILPSCRKEPLEQEPYIKELSDVTLKYGNILTISGRNFNTTRGASKVFITDSINSYSLIPLSVSSGKIEVEIYNQEDPTSLIQLTSFYVGIKTADTIIWADQKATLTTSWQRVSDFPGTGRYKSTVFNLGKKLFAGAGAAGTVFKDFYEYNPASDSWTRKADLPVARCYPRSFSNSVNGFMGAGYSSDNSSKIQLYDFYKYDPQLNLWSAISNYPDNISGFYIGYTVTVDGRPFISLSNQVLTMREWTNESWKFFQTVPDMIDCPAPGVFSIGKKFYIIAGNRINNAFSNSVWEFNSESAVWTKKANFPGPARFAPASFSIGNYGYYGCGMATDQQQYKDMWRYDPSKDKWIRIEDFRGGIRSHLIGSSDGNFGYIGLGLVMSPIEYKNDFWKYDPD